MRGLTATLVYNPSSGKRKAPLLAKRFQDLWFEKTGTKPVLRSTRSREDIRKAAAETADKSDVQVFLGGDGTLSEGLQGLFEHSKFRALTKPIALLPAGTGNSFLRDFGITDFESAFDALCQALEKNEHADIDVGLLSYEHNKKEHKRIVMNIWGVGFIPAVTKLAIQLRILGSLNYTLATLAKVTHHTPYKYNAYIDGKARKLCCDFVTISNSRYTGGKMLIAPPVRPNDAKLFMVMPELKMPHKVLAMFPKIFTGEHIKNPFVHSQFLHDFRIETPKPIPMNVDGELEVGSNPHLKIFPKAWKAWVVHV
jgi:diacylglycerol kinase (ATP)